MSSNTKLLEWKYLCLNILLKELETIDRRTQFNFIEIDRVIEKQMDNQEFLQNFQSKYLYFQSTILEILNQNQYSFEEIYQALIDEDTGLFIKEAYEFTVAKQIAELLGNLIDPITNKTLRYRLKSLLSYQKTQLEKPEKNDNSKQTSLFSKNITELDKFIIKRAIEVLNELPATKTIKTRTELIRLFNRHPEEIEKEIVLKQFAEHTTEIIKQAYPLAWSLVYDWDLRATLDDPESNYSETESIFKFYIAMLRRPLGQSSRGRRAPLLHLDLTILEELIMKMEFEVIHFINRDLVIFKLGTVRGRHQMPVENYIFEEDVTDFEIIQIESHVENYLKNLLEAYCEKQAPCLTLEELRERCDFRVDLYITGLTYVTTSAIKMCKRQDLNLTIFHYDPTTQDYKKQHMG